MRSIHWEQRIRQYVHVDALLKHFATRREQRGEARMYSPVSTQELIEQVNQSQADKWRKYAQSEDGGSDRSPGPNFS
jgi:hypothetical protein